MEGGMWNAECGMKRMRNAEYFLAKEQEMQSFSANGVSMFLRLNIPQSAIRNPHSLDSAFHILHSAINNA
jgi:hypothetical protein